MTELIAALAKLAGLLEDAVYGADRAQVSAFVQRGGEDLCRWLVTEALRIQDLKDPLVFGRRQGARGGLGRGAGVEMSA